MQQNYDRFLESVQKLGCEYERDVPMSCYTSFQIGGKADVLVKPASEEVISKLVKECKAKGLFYVIIGKGSNLLVSDDGIRGVVILCGQNLSAMRLLDETTIECEAGTPLSSLCCFAQRNGLSGLEFAYGIPGSVGGACAMNAGAYGGEMKDVLVCCYHIDEHGQVGKYEGAELAMSYRRSAYTNTRYCITRAVFRLTPKDPALILERMQELMQRRKDRQPLDLPSAGSTFKRPEGAFAAALIEQCGLKGRQIGGAKVSEKHSGFVVNINHASCADVLMLIDEIRTEVQRKTGYILECEVKRI